jgi:hypothetical protein
MTERMTFTPQEIANGRETTDQQVRRFLDLAAEGLIEPGYEATYFNNLTLELDNFFEHRAREVTGAGTTPLNELELIGEGLRGEGIVPVLDEIAYVPSESVLGLEVGQEIELTADQFVELSDAVFAEIEAKFRA